VEPPVIANLPGYLGGDSTDCQHILNHGGSVQRDHSAPEEGRESCSADAERLDRTDLVCAARGTISIVTPAPSSTGPHLVYRPAGEGQSEFFFNERTGESTWDNPVEAPQYELFAQFNLFVRWLQHLHRSHENAAVGCDSRHQGWRTGGNDGETTRYPSFTKQKLRYPSFMVHELGIGASSIEGSPGILNNMLSSPVFPDELEDYVRWIRLSLTTTVPSANLESVLESKRPALPPLTGLNLNHLSTERQEGTPLQQQHPASAPTSSVAPAAQATRLRASVSARGSACHRRSSLPPLTALPLRRALLPLQKPPALERSPRQRSAPLLVTGPAAQLSGARPASQVFGSSS